MDKYKRVEKSRREEQTMEVDPNEIRITQQGKVRSYISYANGLFAEKNERRVVLKAMGNAISKAVTVAEILKHRVANLHQVTRISSIETVDVYEPLEEGLDRIETTRHIPGISIQLSLDQLEQNDPGYQSPIPLDQVTAGFPTYHEGREYRKSRGHSRRSGRNGIDAAANAQKTIEETDEVEAGQQTPGEDEASSTNAPTARGKRGKGRGRGRNGKSHGRTSVEVNDNNPKNAVEQQVESEAANAATNRKVKRGRKGRKTIVNGIEEKETEIDELTEKNVSSNGRDNNAASSTSADKEDDQVTEA
ncbi:aspartyl protease family [Plasmopara halstedii]|uniref:Aspartyl protease family n=1 Tax=Plasmopara halstedii TaxID=4781 RepID=A0A0P1AU07_PLAHL|nr:aspartyl protease family [Plasmopara halstedii]CEG44850.1 aspartyl protease family [Plasmopara halstedii]|eukprot:XP_024581219.1 aspartyl protease family [Plasmopara halstedii]